MASRIKNKAAAPVQISAEMLLKEASEHQMVKEKAPTTRFHDEEELKEFQGRKRSEFEKYVRIAPERLHNWSRYAEWEASQKDLMRARSVWERSKASVAAVVDACHISLETSLNNELRCTPCFTPKIDYIYC